MEIPWSDLARLRVLRRLDELARRRCGVAPGVALATGRILVAEPDRARCGRLAVDAARGAGGVVPYACHEGRVELAAPIVVGESYEGCVFGSVNAGGDVALLGDLLDLYATEITDYIGERMPRVEAGGLRYSYDDIIGRSPSVMWSTL